MQEFAGVAATAK